MWQLEWTKTLCDVLTLPDTLEMVRVLIGEGSQHHGKGFRLGVGHLSSALCSRSTLAADSSSTMVPAFTLGDMWSRGHLPSQLLASSFPATFPSTHLLHPLPWPLPWTFPSPATAPPQNHLGHKLLRLQLSGMIDPTQDLLTGHVMCQNVYTTLWYFVWDTTLGPLLWNLGRKGHLY